MLDYDKIYGHPSTTSLEDTKEYLFSVLKNGRRRRDSLQGVERAKLQLVMNEAFALVKRFGWLEELERA